FISIAIEEPLNIGSGHGPTNHFAYKVNRMRA
ncbi:bifunctional hydroxymethylpyrimidine kinase/phosphomethylpyrimidine kinase, partial [Bacillus velezensis]